MATLLHIAADETAELPNVTQLRASGFDVRTEAADQAHTPFDIAVIDTDVRAPLRVARALRGESPESHIVFLTTPDSDAVLRRELLVARLGTDWSIAPAGEPHAVENVVRQAVDTRERRRRFRTSLGRINARLAEPPAASRRALISDHFLAGVLDQLSDAVVVLDSDGTVVAHNGAAAGAFGSIHRGASFLEVLPPEARQALETAAREGQAESLFVTHHSLEYGLRATLLRDPAGEVMGMALVARDITAFRMGERRRLLVGEAVRVLSSTLDVRLALQRLCDVLVRELADLAFADVAEGERMVRYAVAGRTPREAELMQQVLGVNSATQRDHPSNAAIARGEVLVNASIDDAMLQRMATSPEHLEVLRQLQPHAFVVAPLRTGERTVGALVVARTTGPPFSHDDVTIVQEIAREATGALHNIWAYHRAAETNRLKDEFLATLSHELRTPMTAILGWSQILRLEVDRKKVEEGLLAIERSARMQAQLIDDLLDLSRMQMGKMQFRVRPFVLADVARAAIETVRPAAEARRITLLLDTSQDGDAVVAGDPDRMQQVIWNLLSNAVKFSDPAGEVCVTLRNDGGKAAQVIVTDRGHGIDPAFLPHVFERFRQADSATTRRFGGLGLGLAIVKQLVEMHGGSIEATSPGLGQGATFTVTVPLASPGRRAESATAATTQLADLTGARILIVESDAATATVITAVLERAGARIRLTHSVAAALDALRNEPADLLVSDVAMADEDGLALIRMIRGTLRIGPDRLPALALTDFAGVDLRVTLLASGFQQFLTKPVDPEVLTNVLAGLLRPGVR